MFFQGAAAVAGAGVIQTICLPLLSVYEIPANGGSQVEYMMLFSLYSFCLTEQL